MEVLIVAKTHMKNSACVGAFDIAAKRNIRLLTANSENQPVDTKFEVGQIWDIDYTNRSQLIAPHIEDVLIQNAKFLRNQPKLQSFLLSNALIWEGSPLNIFNGKVQFDLGKSGFITSKKGLPNQSVGFWLADKDLEFTIFGDHKHYFYFGDYGEICAFPFVGYMSKVEKIKQGTLIRISLARWWRPNERIDEKRCYCQLSGWYSD